MDGSTVTIERQTEEGYEVVTGSTPAVVSVWDTINEPRYPSFKGIMEAKKKPVQTLTLADLGIVGRTRSASPAPPPRWSSTPSGPPRQGGTRVTDEGEGGVKLVEFLASEKFV